MDVSVIIPTLNEESCLAQTLASVRRQQPAEIIVVDGGSTDATGRIARAADCVLHAERGRSAQMNLGAQHARGEVLLFLHADCTLEEGALREAVHLLGKPRVIAGCYSMCVRAPGLLFRSIDSCATARVRFTGIIYGDQGLFLSRKDFARLGGFPMLRFMEDLFFSQTLRHHGKIAVAKHHVYVSPRRWQRTGLVRQTLRNWTLTALAAMGMHPNRLAQFYPQVR